MFDGSEKLVKNLKVHDMILSQSKNVARVEYIIKTDVNQTLLCNINGLYITPYHPILVDGIWKYPRDVAECEVNDVDTIYSLVLSNDHIVCVNDIPVITLGHGFTDSIVKHDYLGTQRVIKDLERIHVNGVIVNPTIIRDTNTNMIIAMH
jgi:hypothetical protein